MGRSSSTPKPQPKPQQPATTSPPIQAQPHLQNISQRGGASPNFTKDVTPAVQTRSDLSSSLNLGERRAGLNLTGENNGTKKDG